ncbi:hypothetical protein [Streptomyces sp. NPDC056105]|uniref:hypothetical protein n=1 Tax=Streptomyces sp. NPDC056105 TaxID=3345714 RepID=UPI0035E0017D
MLTHVPDGIEFATEPQLADALVERARTLRIGARRPAGDEVYGGREPRHHARRLSFDYALVLHGNHQPTTGAGRFTATELADPARLDDGLAANAHRQRDQGRPPLRLGHDRRPPGRRPDGDADGHSYLLVRRHYPSSFAVHRPSGRW